MSLQLRAARHALPVTPSCDVTLPDYYLQAWLRDMLRRPSVLDMDAVREFLELDKHVPVVSKAAGEGVAAAAATTA